MTFTNPLDGLRRPPHDQLNEVLKLFSDLYCMELDASKLTNPLAQQKKRVLREHVCHELQLIRQKVLLASSMGVSEILYQVRPTFLIQDPSLVQSEIVSELRRKHFHADALDDYSVMVKWGPEAAEKTSSK